MKANELMIADWVYDKMLKGYGKIEVLTPFAIQCDIHTDTHHMDFFEPIPLTEEILKANGFMRTSGGYRLKLDYRDFEVMYDENEDFYIRVANHFSEISFVHDLQHALRLCGLNELADNFKV